MKFCWVKIYLANYPTRAPVEKHRDVDELLKKIWIIYATVHPHPHPPS